MRIEKISFEQVNEFSNRDKAYVRADERLKDFYKYEVEIKEFSKVLEDKKKEKTDRQTLVNYLKRQYSKLTIASKLQKNIDLLEKENTFTIITAHQPSLFTGPLYYIYKICSAINLCNQLKETYRDYNFVPVFITGGEDHDFEEVNHVKVFNNSLVWESEEQGSVGAMKTKQIKPLLEELSGILGKGENAVEILEILKSSLDRNDIYSDATVDMVNQLFGEYGLVVANMNSSELKSIFKPYIKKEIFDQKSVNLINDTFDRLAEAGFKSQAFPRDINFFYLKDQLRSRIVEEDNVFKVLDTEIVFTKEEMELEIENHPERFSPNVVMRPLYQEVVFPNLAYIGGGGELAYWLERKSQFEYFGVNFPMLIRRNSVLWLDKTNLKKLSKLNLDWSSLFTETESLIKLFVKGQAEAEIDFKDQKKRLAEIFNEIKEIAVQTDPTLGKTVMADMTKSMKTIEQLEGRVVRAEKAKHDVSINQIRGLKDKLFPSNGLQERKDNFIPFYLKHGRSYFEVLIANLNPLDKNFVVILEEAE